MVDQKNSAPSEFCSSDKVPLIWKQLLPGTRTLNTASRAPLLQDFICTDSKLSQLGAQATKFVDWKKVVRRISNRNDKISLVILEQYQ